MESIQLSVITPLETKQDAGPQNARFHEVIRGFGDDLNENDVELFRLVKHGTPQEVEDFITKIKNEPFDLNKKDAKLHTVLQLAVLQRNLEMVDVLVRAGCWDAFALELAGALHLDEIVQLFIANISTNGILATKQDQDDNESENPDNSRNIKLEEETRGMLKAAVDAEDYEGIRILVQKLETNSPTSQALSLDCFCSDCREITSKKNAAKGMKKANERLDVCHILSSPAYILVTAKNPIWKALEWANHLRTMAEWQTENKQELLQLAERSSKLAMDLLPICYEDRDANVLFEVPHEVDKDLLDVVVKNTLKYRRLHDAIGVLQKEFIAHPTCQHVISKLWLGAYYSHWNKWSKSRRTLHVLYQIILTPVIFFLFLFQVNFAKDCVDVPLNRFIYAATSYSFFLANLVANQYGDQARNWPAFSVDGYDIIIGVWVVGHICKIVTDCTLQQNLSYIRLWWITYDAIMMVFFVTGAITFIAGFGLKNGQIANWRLVLVSQGLYAVAMTLACLRILQWLHLSSSLGPLVISFNRMNYVLRIFFVIFGIIVFSFSIGIHTVYKNFQSDSPADELDTFFSSYIKTLKILFWAIFGKGEGRYASIPNQYYYFVQNMTVTEEFENSFTVFVGYALWSLFHIAVVIVLLNMLIAVMTHCYQNTQNNADTEWKFACTKLQMYYIEKNSRFPPPFNIIALIFRMFSYLFESHKADTVDDGTDDKLQEVVKRMIERYLHEKELAKISEQAQ